MPYACGWGIEGGDVTGSVCMARYAVCVKKLKPAIEMMHAGNLTLGAMGFNIFEFQSNRAGMSVDFTTQSFGSL